MPARHASSVSGQVRSPRTVSTCGGKPAPVRVAHERADLSARRRQLSYYLPADVAGAADDEDAIHKE